MTKPIEPGTICRYVGGEPENRHVLCTAIERCDCGCGKWVVELLTSALVATPFGPVTAPAGAICAVGARYLVPLRDDDGEDESLTWAGKPNETIPECLEAMREAA